MSLLKQYNIKATRAALHLFVKMISNKISIQSNFSFHISILRVTSIWPNSNILLSIIPISCAVYGGSTALTGVIYLVSHEVNDHIILIGCALALADFLGYIYARWCVRSCLHEVIELMNVEKVFENFYPKEKCVKTASQVSKFTKFFFIYAVMGNMLNNILALYDGDSCNNERLDILKRRDPCGLMARGYSLFDANEFPLFHICYGVQAVGCFAITAGILMSAMVQISMTQWTIDQLRHCRTLISSLKMDGDTESVRRKISLVVEYHVNIITYSRSVDRAFSKMLLLHLTLTSLVISVLGFVILTSDNWAAILRHCLHLCGWIMLLSLTCYYGQLLIDEGLAISDDIYNVQWYLAQASVQKDIQMVIMRGQEKLKITCAGVGEMSLATFLAVMKSAYSYLTLLLKLKG